MKDAKPAQCPFKIAKYVCRYGSLCVDDLKNNLEKMPSEWNECSVAQRQLNARPWKNERQVKWVYDGKGYILGSHPVPDVVQIQSQENQKEKKTT